MEKNRGVDSSLFVLPPQLFPCVGIQLNSTQLNSTQMNAADCNSTRTLLFISSHLISSQLISSNLSRKRTHPAVNRFPHAQGPSKSSFFRQRSTVEGLNPFDREPPRGSQAIPTARSSVIELSRTELTIENQINRDDRSLTTNQCCRSPEIYDYTERTKASGASVLVWRNSGR
jgi:hypothetical protein